MIPISRPELAALIDLGLRDEDIANYLRSDVVTVIALRKRYVLSDQVCPSDLSGVLSCRATECAQGDTSAVTRQDGLLRHT